VERTFERRFPERSKKGFFYNTYAGSNRRSTGPRSFNAILTTTDQQLNHGPIGRREQLKAYDPVGYELCRTTFNLSPEQDWRYSWLQLQPTVIKPPAKFKIDAYYTKFTWAREFIVIGRDASDDALLHANETIRRLFAYRHDILKAFIAEGMKLVVLGPKEHISDLPEYKKINDPISPSTCWVDTRLFASVEAPGGKPGECAGESERHVCRRQSGDPCLADAIYNVTGVRPQDPNFEKRPRSIWQQYELRVQRSMCGSAPRRRSSMKRPCGEKMAGHWSRNRLCRLLDRSVLAYFDALGQDDTPVGASHPINTREKLKEYDPGLYALVNETMAYETQVDWRYQPYKR